MVKPAGRQVFVEAVLKDFSQATMLQPGSSAEVGQLDKVITK